MLPLSSLQEGYRTHRFKLVTAVAASKNVTAVTASRILPQSRLQECYRSHRGLVSRMLPQSSLQACYCSAASSHRFKNLTAVTASRITASSILPQSPLQACFPRSSVQECYRSHLLRMLLQSPWSRSLHCYCCQRYKNVTAAAASRILPLSLLQELVYFASRRCPLTHTHCLGSLAGIICF